MSSRLIIHNCTIEMILPTLSLGEYVPPKVHLRADRHIENVVIQYEGRTIRIPRMLLTKMICEMLPTIDDDKVVYFVEETAPDTPIVR